MARDLLLLCQEYLRSSSPATRAKAVAALAARGDSASAAELAQRVLTEEDANVRERALEAIAGLTEPARAIALEPLAAALADSERGRRIRAHDLLTQLRNRGVGLPQTRRSWLQALRLAASTRRAAARTGRRAFEGSVRGWGFFYALLGTLVTCLLITYRTEAVSPWLLAAVGGVALVVSPALARAASAGAKRGDGYLDRVPGWAAEILGAGIGGLPIHALLGVTMLFLWPSLGLVSPATVALLGLGILVQGFFFTAAIRTATLSCSVIARRSWGTLLGAGAGWGAGLAAATLGLYLVGWGAHMGQLPSEVVAFAAGFWLFALPVAAGVGAVFARLEHDTVAPRRMRWRAALALPSLLAGGLLVLGWMWFFGGRAPQKPLLVEPEISTRTEVTFARAPVEWGFDVNFRQKARARILDDSTTDLTLAFRRKGQRRKLGQAGLLIERELEPGKYLLEIAPAGASSPNRRTMLFEVAQQVSRLDKVAQGFGWAEDDPTSYRVGVRAREAIRVEVTFNSDPDLAISAVLSALLAQGKVREALEGFNDAFSKRPQIESSVGLLDQLCRAASLRGLLDRYDAEPPAKGQTLRVARLPTWAEVDLLTQTCNRAVVLSDDNGAVRDSRGLARILAGDPKGAIKDFEVFESWTSDPKEAEQRRRWITALSFEPPGEVPAPDELRTLLEQNRARDVARWTRDAAQAHVLRGFDLLSRTQQPPPSPTHAGMVAMARAGQGSDECAVFADEAVTAFRLVAQMVPALSEDETFRRTVCGAALRVTRRCALPDPVGCGGVAESPEPVDSSLVPNVPDVVFSSPVQE